MRTEAQNLDRKASIKHWIIIGLFTLLALLHAWALTGCASTDIYDGNMKLLYHIDGNGFGRDTKAVIEKKNKDGSEEKLAFECTSNVSGIMGAFNQIMGTLVAGYGQAK